MNYEIEVFDSKNTSTPQVINRLIKEPQTWVGCHDKAQEISRTNKYPVVARAGRKFAAFENGVLTEWSE